MLAWVLAEHAPNDVPLPWSGAALVGATEVCDERIQNGVEVTQRNGQQRGAYRLPDQIRDVPWLGDRGGEERLSLRRRVRG